MRTTVTLDDDVALAVKRLQRERAVGVSEAINRLARAGMTVQGVRKRFRQRSAALGLKVDPTNVAEALDLLA